jgi:hypothetical protein
VWVGDEIIAPVYFVWEHLLFASLDSGVVPFGEESLEVATWPW